MCSFIGLACGIVGWDRDDCRILLQELVPDAKRLFAAPSVAEILVVLIKLGTVRQRSDVLHQLDGQVKAMAFSLVGSVGAKVRFRQTLR